MISQAELEEFFEGLVARVQSMGGHCAITSGMACVQYGVAQSTKDCDILCSKATLTKLFQVLSNTEFLCAKCSYRGHLTAPIDQRWLRGGWTAHVQWKSPGRDAHLDIFSVAPRATTQWESEMRGLLAGMHTVAELKRTDRAKDWPLADNLGVKLIEAADLRGWLHIHDSDPLRAIKARVPIPREIIELRPVLQLLVDDDPRLKSAVFAEIVFWQQLDRRRLEIHDTAVRPYFGAVKKDVRPAVDLAEQHAIRVSHAEALLPKCPILEYGIDRLISDARRATAEFVIATALEWLPDATRNFAGLEQ